ncbi:hypothetical protein AN948_18865 [Rhodococcus sp. ADH]|nr:hypothetical protein AN948_18865 [Rhodococcus sp. ADH]
MIAEAIALPFLVCYQGICPDIAEGCFYRQMKISVPHIVTTFVFAEIGTSLGTKVIEVRV